MPNPTNYLDIVISETFTVAATGTVYLITNRKTQHFTLQIKGTGAAATAWNVVLEGSLNNTDFSTILTHTDAVGDGIAISTGANFHPFIDFRIRCVSITLGSATNIIARALGYK